MFSARFPACSGYGRHQKSFKPQWLFYMFPHVKKMFDVTGETKPTRWDPDVCQDVFLVSPKLYHKDLRIRIHKSYYFVQNLMFSFL